MFKVALAMFTARGMTSKKHDTVLTLFGKKFVVERDLVRNTHYKRKNENFVSEE